MIYCDLVFVTTLHVTGQPYMESAWSFASQSAWPPAKVPIPNIPSNPFPKTVRCCSFFFKVIIFAICLANFSAHAIYPPETF